VKSKSMMSQHIYLIAMAASLVANVIKIYLCICLESQCFSRRKWIVEECDYSYFYSGSFMQKFRDVKGYRRDDREYEVQETGAA